MRRCQQAEFSASNFHSTLCIRTVTAQRFFEFSGNEFEFDEDEFENEREKNTISLLRQFLNCVIMFWKDILLYEKTFEVRPNWSLTRWSWRGGITPSKQLGQPGFFSFFSHAVEAGKNQNVNWASTTRQALSPTVVWIKGRSIYPLVGSCLGYYVIPYFCGSDLWHQRYVNPAVQNAEFPLALPAQLLFRRACPPSAWVLTCPPCPA